MNKTSRKNIHDEKQNTMEEVTGSFCDNDDSHWFLFCPSCEREIECAGFFDSGDTKKCKCGCVFKVSRVYFEDGGYIE